MNLFNGWKEKLYKSTEEYLLKKVDNDKMNKELEKAKATHQDGELTVEQEAILFAQCIEKKSLKSPSQAVFPAFDEFEVTKNEDGTFLVAGYVDAPNSYGATTRGNFKFLVTNRNGRWEYAVSEAEIKTSVITTTIISIVVCAIIIGAIVSFVSYVSLLNSF